MLNLLLMGVRAPWHGMADAAHRECCVACNHELCQLAVADDEQVPGHSVPAEHMPGHGAGRPLELISKTYATVLLMVRFQVRVRLSGVVRLASVLRMRLSRLHIPRR